MNQCFGQITKNGKHCILYRHHIAHYCFNFRYSIIQKHSPYSLVLSFRVETVGDHSNVQVYKPNTGKHAFVSETLKGMSSALYGNRAA